MIPTAWPHSANAESGTDFHSAVVAGLGGQPKSLPSRFFYDAQGSALFEQICDLPEYYLTRTEMRIMRRHAPAMAQCIGPECWLVEYGSGSSRKTRFLLDALVDPLGYVPVDVSFTALAESHAALRAEYPELLVCPILGDFTGPLELPMEQGPFGRCCVYFPGSTLGNFPPGEAKQLLQLTAERMGPKGLLLLGVDRKKDPAKLHAAYNDAAGVTAAFNMNLLARINRELGGNLDLKRFAHYAFYEPRHGRIEMHLVSKGRQCVVIGGERFSFVDGESIRTEYSYKFSGADLAQLAAAAGLQIVDSWQDEADAFSVQLWQVA